MRPVSLTVWQRLCHPAEHSLLIGRAQYRHGLRIPVEEHLLILAPPRDPAGHTHLGSPPRINAELAAIHQAKLAAHPGATADERMRLLAEARSEYEGPVGVQYFDTTFSVDKTLSLAHASALASAVEAKQAGDLKLAAEWEERAAGIWAEIEKSVRMFIGYMQQESGFVRTGHHGRFSSHIRPENQHRRSPSPGGPLSDRTGHHRSERLLCFLSASGALAIVK